MVIGYHNQSKADNTVLRHNFPILFDIVHHFLKRYAADRKGDVTRGEVQWIGYALWNGESDKAASMRPSLLNITPNELYFSTIHKSDFCLAIENLTGLNMQNRLILM